MRRRVASTPAVAALLVACLSAAGVYLVVGRLSGVLYAAAILLLGTLVARKARSRGRASRPREQDEGRPRRWRRKSTIIAELQVELAATLAAMDEQRRVRDALQARLQQEAAEARTTQETLEAQIRDLGSERDAAWTLLAEKRALLERWLGQLSVDVGRQSSELAELERDLEQVVAIARS
jgi:hypothetical protein